MKKSEKILGLMALITLCGTAELKAAAPAGTIINNDHPTTQLQDYNYKGTEDVPNPIYRITDNVKPTANEIKVNVEAPGTFDADPNTNTDDMTVFDIYGSDNGKPAVNIKKASLNLKNTDSTTNPTSTEALSVDLGASYVGEEFNANIEGKGDNVTSIYYYDGIYVGGSDQDLSSQVNSKVSIDTVNIDIKNTSPQGNNTTAGEISGYIVGVKADSTEKDKAEFVSSKDVNINLTDKNTVDNSVLVGIGVMGEGSKATLNNSNIVLKGNASVKDNNPKINGALVIGSNIESFYDTHDIATKNSGLIESKGKMILNTEEAKNIPTVAMLGIDSELKADFENSSAEIKSGNTAIKYWGKTFTNDPHSVEGKNQTVSLKNAKISSKSTDRDNYLIDVDANVRNATLNLSGKDTLAKADNGKLLYIGGNRASASDIRVNVTDGAKIVGEINGSSSGEARVTLDKNAVWKIDKEKSYGSYVAELNIKNGSILDLTEEISVPLPPGESHYAYELKIFDKNGYGTLTNDGGTINLANKKYSDQLSIWGNYTGKNNAQIKMNTLWNKGGDENGKNSESDIVVIGGSASGTTRVIPVSVNGKENLIDGSVEKVAKEINTVTVVKVLEDVDKSAGAFVGKAQTTGAGEVQLTSKIGKDGSRNFYWTLNATNADGSSSNIESNPESNSSNQEGAINEKPEFIPIFAAVTPAYVNISKVNRDLGYTTIATLHERRGENDIKSSNTAQAWARVIGKKTKDYGKNRFSFESDIYGVQAGYDFSVKTDESGKRNTGVYFSNLNASTDFFDKYRAENGMIVADKYTGKVKTRDFSLGVTTTKYYSNGLYLDLVGQVSFIKNKFNSRSDVQAKQNGKAIVLSAETGRTHKITENFTLEPQVQLIYQNLKLKDFNDGLRQVHYGHDSAFRGRIGFRGTFNKDKATDSTSFYTLANIWHDFNGNIKANIGQDRVEEKYAKNMGEIGLGIQIPVTKTAYVYSDVRYEKELRSDAKHKGYRGTFGFKYSF